MDEDVNTFCFKIERSVLLGTGFLESLHTMNVGNASKENNVLTVVVLQIVDCIQRFNLL